MKKVKVSGKNVTLLSHDKANFEYPQQVREYSNSSQTGTFAFPNRWDVEASKSLPTSGSQMTSKGVFVVHDLGSESFLKRTAASQIGVAKFQETRLLSQIELRRRTTEALRRAKERLEELLRQEENLENES
jgi:hypothetical protein